MVLLSNMYTVLVIESPGISNTVLSSLFTRRLTIFKTSSIYSSQRICLEASLIFGLYVGF